MKLIFERCYIYNRHLQKLLVLKRKDDSSYENVSSEDALKGDESNIKTLLLYETGQFINDYKLLYDEELKNTNIVFRYYIAYTENEDICISDKYSGYEWEEIDDYLELVSHDIKESFNKNMVIYQLI